MEKLIVCASQEVLNSGDGFRFKVVFFEEETTAFVIRVDNQVHAYLNRCSHLPVELDWNYGHFLDETGFYIVCASHGATYEAKNGVCISGPCLGQALRALKITEEEGFIYWWPENDVKPHPKGIQE